MLDSQLPTFECLGLALDKSGDQAQGDCPFCEKSRHFYVNPDTGQWDCKSCGLNGNAFTFLEKMVAFAQQNTTEAQYRRLAKLRGIPWEVFQKAGVCYSGDEWWIPGITPRGTVADIRRWLRDNNLVSTTGCQVQMWGMEKLVLAQAGDVIWLCEGEWDGMALTWLLELADMPDVCVAVPGASIFKKEWIPYFAGKAVYICYDNDGAGESGAEKVGNLLQGTAKEIKYLTWTASRPKGYDIRDFVKEGRGKQISAEEGIDLLEKMLASVHCRKQAEDRALLAKKKGIIEKPISFKEVMAAFAKWVRMDRDMTDAVAICLATALSTAIEGDPLWLYLIGPPGGGKSLVLMSMSASDDCMFRSTLTPASLVSGFASNPDPSLLPEMNGKTAIFKDGTELLSMNPDARKEAYGVLRGAFDGSVTKSFGNGVKRNYKDLHFSMLIGMTPAVHGDNQATMGERFLKFEMKENIDAVEDKIRQAMKNISKETKMQKDLTEAVRLFLLRKLDPERLPEVPDWVIERVVALSQLLSMLRANVEREQYGDRDIRYRAGHEVGTRIAKQLIKLGQSLTYVFNTLEIDINIFDIIYRVAMDTCIGFHFDITKAIILNGNQGMTIDELCRVTGIPKTTMGKRLADLEQLNVVRVRMVAPTGPVRQIGPTPKRYFVTDRVSSLWERSSGSPIPSAASLKMALKGMGGSDRSLGQRPG